MVDQLEAFNCNLVKKAYIPLGKPRFHKRKNCMGMIVINLPYINTNGKCCKPSFICYFVAALLPVVFLIFLKAVKVFGCFAFQMYR